MKMIKLMPRPINMADKNPTKYIPKLIVNINIVTVPGHGTIPAVRITPRSVEVVLQALQPQLELCK